MGLLEAIHEAEIELFRAVNAAGTNSPLDIVMVCFTIIGISYVIILVAIPLWIQGKKDSGFDFVVLVVMATLIAEVLKLVIDRSRPIVELDDVKMIVSASGPSLPSGHATRAFAAATLILLVEPRKYGAVAFALATLIGASRVYLGVHWPSDVVAGAILGVLTTLLFVELAKRSAEYRSMRSRVVALITGAVTRVFSSTS